MRADLKVMGGAALAALALAFVMRPRRLGECDVRLLGLFTRPVDPYAPFEPVTGCESDPQPGVEAFRDWVMAAIGGRDVGIMRACTIGKPSKHHEGRAWDWGPPSSEVGDAFVACLTTPDEDGNADALARRAGLRTIIWNRRIWKSGQWAPYTGSSPHTDHVHFGFGWDGARGQTSLYELLEDGGMVPTQDVELIVGGGEGVEVRELLAVKGLEENTSGAFKRKAIRLADGLGLDPSLWLAVMSFETGGTFDPAIRNPLSGAVGLIQFTKKYAPIIVGKTTDELAAMNALDQLDYVDKWYRHNDINERIEHQRDYYLAVFAPSGIGKPATHALYVSPSKAYQQNAAMDLDGDGSITVGDVAAKFNAFVDGAKGKPPIVVPMKDDAEGVAIVAALALAVGVTAAIVEST